MTELSNYQSKGTLAALGLICAITMSYTTIQYGIIAPVAFLLVSAASVFFTIIVKNPFIGMMTTVSYCFLLAIFSRELPVYFPFGYLVEVLYAVLWVALLIKISNKDWKLLRNDLFLLFFLWFIVSVFQIINPGSSVRGWISEIRTSGLDSFLLVPAGFLIFKTLSHLNYFLILTILLSLFGAFWGIKQLHFGLSPGEQAFLEANPTHLLWGQLRVFSFYRDAGQFGASQAHLALITGVLTLAPFKLWLRISLLFITLIFIYAMLISGTRGAFFVLVPGLCLALVLFKNVRIFAFGFIFLIMTIGILKFTYLGSSNYYVDRLRTALNPEDASLNVRFISQQVLGEYLKDRPFGGGLGVIGYAGTEYNSGHFLSTIAPDSYWVKVWAMYGITGFLFWFCMMSYILGKCCGIVWNIKDKMLRIKLIALTAGFFGIFISSYGNEVINTLPSSIIVYLSLVLIYLGPKLDDVLQHKHEKMEGYAV